MWKKVIAVIAAIGGVVLAFLLGRGISNGRGIPGVAGDIREAGESLDRAGNGIADATGRLDDSHRLAGEIADRNRDNKSDVDRAKEILRRAKARSDKVGRNRKPG